MLRKIRSSSLKSAIRPVLETLENRRLLSATLTLVNPDSFPASDRVIFNTIQHLDPTVPNVVHNQQTLQITDTGTSPLVISNISLSGPWQFLNAPVGGYTNVTVNPGAPLSVTLQFTQSTLPSHSFNETNFTTVPNGGAAISGAMTINSNDSTAPSKIVTLAGYWQNESNRNQEPSLQTITNLLAGYTTNINASPIPDLTETSAKQIYGEEVQAVSWEQANASLPVNLQEIASFRSQGNSSTTYWYPAATQSSHRLFAVPGNQGQTVLPTQSNGTLAASSFNPQGAFGLRVDTEYSSDAINNAMNNTGGGGHHFRFYPARDSTGNYIPNTYLVAMDYGIAQAENFDFQDNVWLMSNARPSGTPATPAGLTATNATSPVLSWTADSYSPVAYNVYRSTSLNGTYTLLTTTAITAPTFTDTTAPAGAVFYQVTAVDTTQNPVATSPPATVFANGGPVGAPYSSTAYNAQPVSFNPLVGATDPTGTIVPTTVTVTTPNHGGTATVNGANGLITYTPSANFVGTETFAYTVADSHGAISAPATVTFIDSAPIVTAPVSHNFSTTTLAGTAVSIPVLSVDLPVTTFNLASVLITSQTTHGTVVANSDGSVTYTPNATFIGGDSFQYTVADNNGQVSSTATVDINVGVEISSAKNASHAVLFPGATGALVTVSLNRGVADVYFDGNGGVLSTIHGKTTIIGNNLHIRDIALSGTTVASVLSITSVHNIAVALGAVTDAAPLGSIKAGTSILEVNAGSISGSSLLVGSLGSPRLVTALQAVGVAGTQEPVSGDLTLAGVRSVLLGGVASATLTLGNVGVTASSLYVNGVVTDANLTSTVPLTLLRAASWTNTKHETTSVTAPSMGALFTIGGFEPSLTLTGTGNAKPTLTSAVVGGALGNGYWNISGTTRNVVIGSTGGAWGATFGTLNALTIKKGGLVSSLNAGVIGSLTIVGDVTGALTAVSAKSVRVSGAVTNTTLDFTAPVGSSPAIGSLVVGGAVNGSSIVSGGNVNSMVVGSFSGSTVLLDTTASSLSNVMSSKIGTATLRSLTVKSKGTSAFSNTSVIAEAILSASTGQVNATSSGGTEGLAAKTFRNLAIGADAGVVHLTSKQLTSQTALNAYLQSKGYVFGNFKIDILSPAQT